MSAELAGNTVILEDKTNLGGLIRKVLFHWPLYLIILLLSLGLAFIYLHYKKPIYSSAAKIYIKDDNESKNDLTGSQLSLFSKGKVVDNEMELIKSPILLEDVIRSNNFHIRYFEKGPFSNDEIYQNAPLKINILTDSNKVGDHIFDISINEDRKISVTYGKKKGKNDNYSI
jgi:uncharacterized protein involved in exopolysaccharide biosynthesis